MCVGFCSTRGAKAGAVACGPGSVAATGPVGAQPAIQTARTALLAIVNARPPHTVREPDFSERWNRTKDTMPMISYAMEAVLIFRLT